MTYILWSSDFASYLEDYLMENCCTWDNGSVWHKDWPLKIYVGHWPIFHGPLILPFYHCHRLKLFVYINKWHWPWVFMPLQAFALVFSSRAKGSQGELIVYWVSMVCRPSVVIHTFKLEYLWRQLTNLDQILYVASLDWGKGCIRFWGRLGQNSGFHGNRKPHWLIMGKMMSPPFLVCFWSDPFYTCK